MTRSEVLFIGGRAGVGKTSLAMELHVQLAAADVKHGVIEGDTLDQAHPAPWEYGLEERNHGAIWHNYRELGYRRLIYTNTVSVLQTDILTRAMSDDPRITAVLLSASDETTYQRLQQREVGSGLRQHLERSVRRAVELEQAAPAWVHRLRTDGQSVEVLARKVLTLTGWLR